MDADLKCVNNGIRCLSILVTGQIMEAVASGRYDLSRLAVIIAQTGGSCCATNRIALMGGHCAGRLVARVVPWARRVRWVCKKSLFHAD